MSKRNVLGETRLLSEYLARQYKGWRIMTQVRVGVIPRELDRADLTEAERAMVGNWRRWADAVCVRDGECHLIEAMILPDPGKVALLDLYNRLLPMTPELAAISTLPRKCVLLMGAEDPVVRLMAHEKGFEVVFFRPPWVDDYLAAKPGSTGRPPLSTI